jgi:hypothetical protein
MDSFKCEFISWEEIYNLSKVVAKRIRQSHYSPDLIIGLARGGLVPARNLSDLLGIKDLLSLKVEHWGITAHPDGEARLKYPFNVDLQGRRVLVVDDITDTGKSMQIATDFVRTLSPADIKTAALRHIKHSEFIPDFFAEEIEWKWVIFPWCFTEDLCNLVKAVVEGEAGVHLEKIRESLEKRYDIRVDEEVLREIMEEMEERGMVKRIQQGVPLWKVPE